MPRLRPATLADAGLLYTWRQRQERAAWYEGEPTSWEEHRDWLSRRLFGWLGHILIWEDDSDGERGVVRIDSNGEVAFYAPDPRDAAAMLQAATVYASEHGGRLKVTLDADNTEALEALKAAGFEAYPAVSLTYTCVAEMTSLA